MNALRDEIKLINNTALGSYLMWRFSLAYINEHEVHEAPPGVLLFLVLPILLHQPTLEFIDSTQKRSGLSKFSDKLLSTHHKKSHLLLSIHDRTQEMKALSLRTIKMAVNSNLITIVPDTGRVVPFAENIVGKPKGIPAIVNKMDRNAEKLGTWFAELSLQDISFYLKVFF